MLVCLVRNFLLKTTFFEQKSLTSTFNFSAIWLHACCFIGSFLNALPELCQRQRYSVTSSTNATIKSFSSSSITSLFCDFCCWGSCRRCTGYWKNWFQVLTLLLPQTSCKTLTWRQHHVFSCIVCLIIVFKSVATAAFHHEAYEYVVVCWSFVF